MAALLLGAATSVGAAAAEVPSPISSKNEAILGGMSALERIAAEQAGLAAAPVIADALPTALPVPGARSFLPQPQQGTAFIPPADPVAEDRPNIFGSVALAVSRTPLDAQWRRAGSAALTGAGPWKTLVASLRTLAPEKRLEAANIWVNRNINFVEDRDQYGRNDLWVEGAQSLRRGRGDCEDYALAKMQLLRAAGIPAHDMYLAIVKDLVRRADHAVLIVRTNGRFLVLDNNTDRLVDANATQDYRPIFTYGAAGSWTHGYTRTADAPRNGGGPSLAAAR
ncbi:MAG TPA: transglutaminase-like cysteine peptidase [Allosphingosinicella sp.]